MLSGIRFIFVLVNPKTSEVHFYDPSSDEEFFKSEGDLIKIKRESWLIDRILKYDLALREVVV